MNLFQLKSSGSVRDTAAGVWLPYRVSLSASQLLLRSIHAQDSQKTCGNLSINTPSFLCPRPELTSDMSRLSARASRLRGIRVCVRVCVCTCTLHPTHGIYASACRLFRDISLQSRGESRELHVLLIYKLFLQEIKTKQNLLRLNNG